MVKPNIRLLLLPVVAFSLLFIEKSQSQNSSQLLQQQRFNSFIETINTDYISIDLLAADEATNLARAHFERGVITENIFYLSVSAAERFFENMSREIESEGVMQAIDKLQLLKKASKGEILQNSSEMQHISNTERSLYRWFLPGVGIEYCTSSRSFTEVCDMINHLKTGNAESYAETQSLLNDLIPAGTSTLLNLLAEENDNSRRAEKIFNWLYTLQVSFIADYTISGWIFENKNMRDLAGRSYLRAGNWSYFQDSVQQISRVQDFYLMVGAIIRENNSCRYSDLPENLKSAISRNTQFTILGIDALARCLSREEIKQNYGQVTLEITPPNKGIATFLASHLSRMGYYTEAYEKLMSRVPRSILTNFTENGPETMSILARLSYENMGEENWRTARELMIILEEEFPRFSSSVLLLQLATQQEYRQSIHTIIE